MQEYRGERYYLCGQYYQRKGVRLHRKMWEDAHGPIPEGYHVHHKDRDRSNNTLENLELMEAREHFREHALERSANGVANIHHAQEAAKEWHGSEEGRDWHREHFYEHCLPAMSAELEKSCMVCGETYMAKKVHAKRSKYCGNNCRQAALRQRRKEAWQE